MKTRFEPFSFISDHFGSRSNWNDEINLKQNYSQAQIYC